MSWKGDVAPVVLVLVQAPEGSWIMLCDREKTLCHLLLGQFGYVSSRAFNPSCGHPSQVVPNGKSHISSGRWE
jgi:hypothetical protein